MTWSIEDKSSLVAAADEWKKVVLGQQAHAGRCQQHLLPLDQISGGAPKVSPNINRYLMRAIDLDLCYGREAIYTYVKIGRFIIVGFVREPNSSQWRGTKVNSNGGSVQPKDYGIPYGFWQYVNERALKIGKLMSEMSPAQKSKVDGHFKNNVGSYLESDAFIAMLADVNSFGDQAFFDGQKCDE